MPNALIGHTGFVGGNLLRQISFDSLFNSKNIREIAGRSFDTLVCAGAPAAKWLANKDPAADLNSLRLLMDSVKTVKAERFVLISTVDVYPNPVQVDEDTSIPTEGSQAYGTHRRLLEVFASKTFPKHHIIRLPALFGKGLKKNVIFDLLNNNGIEKIHRASLFQYYPLQRLSQDLNIVVKNDLRWVNLATEPLSVEEMAGKAFKMDFQNISRDPPSSYDVWTKYSDLFGGKGRYILDKQKELELIQEFVSAQKAGKAP